MAALSTEPENDMKIAFGVILALLFAVAWYLGALLDRTREQDAAVVEVGEAAREADCAATHSLAVQIMRVRQVGAPLADALAVSEDRGIRALVQEAWQRPQWNTRDAKMQEVDRFATLAYSECMTGGAR
jgi:hypothetical protein